MTPLTERARAPRLARLRLRFSPDLEPAFLDYHFQQSLPFMRFAIILAIVLYALFGILDLFIVPDAAGKIWIIRYAVFSPAALFVLGLSFRVRSFKPIAQPILLVLAALCGLGIVVMVAIADTAASSLYYAGLLGFCQPRTSPARTTLWPGSRPEILMSWPSWW